MQYRRLGKAGVKVSVFSYGSWLTFGSQQESDESLRCMQAAYEAGINFFDNAEVYAGGGAEQVMGDALQELGWPRHSYLVSTKYFWGIHRENPNATFTLNRKYLMEAIDKSLERLQLDHVDLVYCHRPDPETPIEETVWAMSDIVASGKALYWGTSEWSAAEIRAAWEIAERHHLRKPVVEQPEYNLLNRTKVETEFARLYEDIGLGLTTFSPLASGMLTGKYASGIPEGSRGQDVEWLQDSLTDSASLAKVAELQTVATDIGCSLAQLALAWTASNPNVSSVIIGARKLDQLNENLKALEVLGQLTDEHKSQIDDIFS
ncbi:MAG: aldo/keto reductase [Acidimicrobiia bacterium]|nr:aldo/keto reductase [Acidimicrobiia bacterium]MDX2468090.1 aldo/keto reductase [Acidimicrobiia bacterium]